MVQDKTSVDIFYGIPGAGKSSLAVECAYLRGRRTIVSTDYVRETQRLYVSPHESPAIAEVTHTAWELHGELNRTNIVAGFLDHVSAVAPGIRAVAAKLVADGFDAIIEGVHFHSALVDSLRRTSTQAHIRATLLVVESAADLRRRLAAKEAVRAAAASRKLWLNNVDTMMVIQDFLIDDARRCDIRIATADEWKRSCVPPLPQPSSLISTTSSWTTVGSIES